MGLAGGVTTELDMYMRWEQAQQWKHVNDRVPIEIFRAGQPRKMTIEVAAHP